MGRRPKSPQGSSRISKIPPVQTPPPWMIPEIKKDHEKKEDQPERPTIRAPPQIKKEPPKKEGLRKTC